MKPSPDKSIVAISPLPSATLPSFALMTPLFETRPPKSATKPPLDTLMRSLFVTGAEAPLPWKLYLPARKSSFLIPSVEATNEPVLMTPDLVMAMPFGFTSITVPGALMVPAMEEGVELVTRFNVADDAPGWFFFFVAPAPTENVFQ